MFIDEAQMGLGLNVAFLRGWVDIARWGLLKFGLRNLAGLEGRLLLLPLVW